MKKLLLIIGMVTTSIFNTAGDDFDPGLSGFKVRVNDLEIPYNVFALFVMPFESLSMEIIGAGDTRPTVIGEGGPTGQIQIENQHIIWPGAVNPGIYKVEINVGPQTCRLNIFVMVPAAQIVDGHLNGYRIGSYPQKPLRDLEVYLPPQGYAEVREDMLSLAVSPHFTLGQFLCKQQKKAPHYLVLREKLLLKLEYLLGLVNEHGFRCDSFTVMSGFRTPYYNHKIGNVKYSRHCWGGAADIFIDENPRDGEMDDLNKDGKIDFKDAMVLYELVDGQWNEKKYRTYRGGLGLYRRNQSHGPFIHVDVRGFRARWGD